MSDSTQRERTLTRMIERRAQLSWPDTRRMLKPEEHQRVEVTRNQPPICCPELLGDRGHCLLRLENMA